MGELNGLSSDLSVAFLHKKTRSKACFFTTYSAVLINGQAARSA